MSKLRLLRYGKVYIVPTYNGIVLLSLLMFSIICATSTGNNILYLFAIVHSIFILLTMVSAHQNLEKIEVATDIDFCYPANRKIIASWKASFKAQDERHCIQMIPKGFKSASSDHFSPNGADISPATTESTSILNRKSRGVYRFSRVKLTSTFPFGLWRVWMWVENEGEIIIFPEPQGDKKLFATTVQDQIGTHQEGLAGEDFKDLKMYAEGDSIFHIDWKAQAKGNGLYIKRFIEGGVEKARIDLRNQENQDLEKALSKAALLVSHCHNNAIPYDLILLRQSIILKDPNENEEHYRRCMKTLAEYQGGIHAA